MPLTAFQQKIAQLLAPLRTEDSHLAGGAALHRLPNSKRYSNDLDYFHDSVERVAEAFGKDQEVLVNAGFDVRVQMNQPGFIRAIVALDGEATKVEWSHDSAWRFLPTKQVNGIGYQLDDIDLAINKLLALAGRDEPRDFLDILYIHDEILPLGALCWAAAGKDPGFTPASLLALIRRRGKYREEDFSRLKLTNRIDLVAMKEAWLSALEQAEAFIAKQPPEEIGCLYFSTSDKMFVAPDRTDPQTLKKIQPHYGRPGGVLPTFRDE